LTCLAAVALTACNKRDDADAAPPAMPAQTMETPATPETTPAAPVTAPAASVPESPPPTGTAQDSAFDVEQVPLSTVALPPFPILQWPDALPASYRNSTPAVDFDETYLIAGAGLRRVEGQLETRWFPNAPARLSGLGSRRNYEQAILALGGAKVNKVGPTDAGFVSRAGGDVNKMLKQMRLSALGVNFPDRGGSYDAYLIRTAQGNTWLTVAIDVDGLNTYLTVLQEKPLRQSVAPMPAASAASQ
ncbi:MAG: hypothetical protein V4739_12550, partial [Pseudomonadota bacterium]